MRVTWLGHATVLIELDGARLLTDPLLRPRVGLLRHAAARTVDPPDAVLISHVHWDHLDVPSLLALGRDVPVVVPRGAARLLRNKGFRDVAEVDAGDTLTVRGATVRAVHAEHASERLPFVTRTAAVGFVVDGTASVYFAGDTDLFDDMHTVAAGLDLALVPIAGWGRKAGAGHLDVPRAAEAVRRLRPRLVVPIHWGTLWPLYRRTPHAGPATADAFVARVAEVAPGVKVRVLAAGESLEVHAGATAAAR